MKIDLHAHTRHSDGTFTPTELIEESARRGVVVQAVTDHDTMGGMEEALAAGERLGVRVVWGVEYSSRDAAGDVHVLGFFPGKPAQPFLDLLGRQREERRTRAGLVMERLKALNILVTWADLKAAGASDDSVGRPHVARALVAKRYAGSVSEAFKRWLAPTRPAYVKHAVPLPEEAVRAIREAGGVPVVAHPGHLKDPDTIGRMLDAGLLGIEVYHPDHRPEQVTAFAALARTRGLIATGGSDFHGLREERYAKPGDRPTPPEEFARIEEFWKAVA